MNILMMTNTYSPHVGGVARSVQAFAEEFRALGHKVLIVAPEFPRTPRRERDVVRVPALQNFNGSDFSVIVPFSVSAQTIIDEFKPDIVHAHHPFLLGSTAARLAREYCLPLVFTHHTMYEQYTHYVPGDSPRMKQFAINLAVGYCNLCDAVIAPSASVARLLRERGVTAPIFDVPTGVDARRFATGDRARIRSVKKIPARAFVVGHLGRLAPEKNLPFLAGAVAAYLKRDQRAVFLLVGGGPSLAEIKSIFRREKLTRRLFHVPQARGQMLVDCYKAMDCFAFASHSETQGMVLTEAMAAGVPVVAIDAPGAREVVRTGENGILLPRQDQDAFVAALEAVAARDAAGRRSLRAGARRTAREFAMPRCARRILKIYHELLKVRHAQLSDFDETPWGQATRFLQAEWSLIKNVAGAATAALVAPIETHDAE